MLGTGAIGAGALLAWLSSRSSKQPHASPRLPERVLRLDPSCVAAKPEAGAPGRVQIIFVSTPPGASVFRAGSDRPLGVTPFSASLDSSPQVETFQFRLQGWREERTALSLRADTEATVVLTPLEARSSAAAASSGAGTGPRSAPRASTGTGAGRPEKPVSGRAPARAELPPAPPAPPPKPVPLDRDAVLNPFE